MECEKRNFQVYRQGRTALDQFYMDEDYNVPDAKSDVKRVILSEGNVHIEDMSLAENYVRVQGNLKFRILYAADEEIQGLASMEGSFPFEEMVYMEEPPMENLFLKSAQADLAVSAVHSRKLNIHAVVELQISSEGREEMELTADAKGEETLYKKYRTEQILKLFAVRKDTCRIREEAQIGGMQESIGSLLWTDLGSRKLDTRVGTDELLLQGELLLFCFYESPEGKTDWIEQTLPYEGRMECPGVQDSMYHQIYPELKDVHIEARMDENGEMRLLGVEAVIEARIVLYEEEEMSLLEDLYSLKQVCAPRRRSVVPEQLLMQNHSKCKVTERLSLPEIQDDILQICHSGGRIQLENVSPQEEGLSIEGVLHVSFLYVKADDALPFDVWQGMVPFSYLLESNATSPDMESDLTCGVEQLAVGLLGNGEVEVKAVLAFNSFLRKPVPIENIEEVETRPEDLREIENRPGIIGYVIREGDELWDLAKRYHTTVEGIQQINGIEDSKVKPGEKLLIFKENMGIL